MAKVFVLADDFTGALDTGVQFSASGASVYVMVAAEGEPVSISCHMPDSPDVLVVDTETRHMCPSAAARRVGALTREAARLGFTHFYKKTDSALRGNVGAELCAMLDASGCGVLAFAPAYPKSGRVTIGGIHYVDGVPLGESVFARDPHAPVAHSAVTDIIGEQTDIAVVVCAADFCGCGSGGSGKGERKCKRERAIYIFDAESDGDLQKIGAYLKERDLLKCLAGCAGFAGALQDIYGIGAGDPVAAGNAGSADISVPDILEESRSLLLVTGSVNPITLKQLSHAAKTGFRVIPLSPEQKLSPTPKMMAETADAAARALRECDRVIITAATCQADVDKTDAYAREHHIPEGELRSRISKNIAQLAAATLKLQDIGALAVFGGDTLYEIISQMGIKTISPIKEIAPGIVDARIISTQKTPKLITKSGGLGSEDALADIVSYLYG